MRQRIQDLAKGTFQYENPTMAFLPEQLELTLAPEETYSGSFTIHSKNQVPMAGTVCSLHSRMECLTPEFSGNEAEIQYQFHSGGLAEGCQQAGEFYVIVNGGEHHLPYMVNISRYYPITSIGTIKNLFDFTNLARCSPDEAYEIFCSPFFENFFKPAERREKLLYRAFRGAKLSRQSMEEFLVGIKKKQKARFSLAEKEKEYEALSESVQGSLAIEQENWGYLEIEVTSDAEFLVPGKSMFNQVEGNPLEYLIRADKLHAGKNYGRISFSSLHQTEHFELCVKQEPAREDALFEKALHVQLLRFYMDFRLGDMGKGRWLKESRSYLEDLRKMDPENPWYCLFSACIYFFNRQWQEGGRALDEFRQGKQEGDAPLWGLYLYATTLQESDPEFVRKQAYKIKRIFRMNRGSLILALILLRVDKGLIQSKARTYIFLEQQAMRACNSPLIYMEAWKLILQNPSLLKKAGVFERRMLFWAVKNVALTREIVLQVQNISPQIKQCHPAWYRILKECFRWFPQSSMLKAINSYCIFCDLYGKEYFHWYDLGVQEGFRLIGLYEAWLRSAPSGALHHIPRAVALYFQYHADLDYSKRALLYAGILKMKEFKKSRYRAFQRRVDQFTMEQLLAGRISKNLARLYEAMLPYAGSQENRIKESSLRGSMTDEVANALSPLLYTHKLACKDDRAVRAIVVYEQLQKEQAFPLSHLHGGAYLPIYGDNCCILLEDASGRRYDGGEDVSLHGLMHHKSHYARECLKYAPNSLSLLLPYFESKRTWHSFLPQDIKKLQFLMDSEAISTAYRREMQPQLIEYYYHSYQGKLLDDYLEQVEYAGLGQGSREQLMELMIRRGVYKKAYEMVLHFGWENVDIALLLTLANRQIDILDQEEDAKLLAFCHDVFFKGKYNEKLLSYLSQYLQAPPEEMEKLWRTAKDFEMDTYQLEERILMQLLYTESLHLGLLKSLFQSYEGEGGKNSLLLACLSYVSWQSFVKEEAVPEYFFDYIGEKLEHSSQMNLICRLAYLKWVTGKDGRSPREILWQEKMVNECAKNNLVFAFFQTLPMKLLQKYGWHDLTFLEYHAQPGSKVVLSYGPYGNKGTKNEQTRDLIPVYKGICVERFILFDQEELDYEIREIRETSKEGEGEGFFGQETTIQGKLQGKESQDGESRFDLINRMAESIDCRQRYQYLEERTKQLFQPI